MSHDNSQFIRDNENPNYVVGPSYQTLMGLKYYF